MKFGSITNIRLKKNAFEMPPENGGNFIQASMCYETYQMLL